MAENLQSAARYSPFVISKVLAAPMRKLIILLLVLAKYTYCSHARKCSQRPFDTPK